MPNIQRRRFRPTAPHGVGGVMSLVAAAALVIAGCAPQGPVAATQQASPAAQAGAPPATSRDMQVAEGRRIAEIQCASCHAIGVSGDSPVEIAPPFRSLAKRYPINSLEEAFAEGILVGHPMMPEFKFTPQQIAALLAYLNTIQDHRAG